MKRFRLLAASALIALSLAGCGGGGGSAGTPPDGGPNPGSETVISGMATKGPITGTVNIYSVTGSGVKGNLLSSAPIISGGYSASIGSYAGAVLIEVTGTYQDEATGTTRTIGADAPMRAALPNASGTVAVAVTPLTELAVQKAGSLTGAGIEAANRLVSGIFNLDITATQPVAPTSAALASASQLQKDYTLALAALSQLSQSQGKPLSFTLDYLAGGISAGGMDSTRVASFQNAAAGFVTNPKNATGVTSLAQTSLAAIDGSIATTATYTLTVTDVPAGTPLYGIQFQLVVPDGLTVRHNGATGAALPGMVTLSNPVAGQPEPATFFSASTGASLLNFALMTTTPFGSGSLATIVCDTLPGYATPPAAAFGIRNLKAVDENGVTIGGVSLTLN